MSDEKIDEIEEIRKYCRDNDRRIAELKKKFIADEHTLLHIRENDDRIEKLEKEVFDANNDSRIDEALGDYHDVDHRLWGLKDNVELWKSNIMDIADTEESRIDNLREVLWILINELKELQIIDILLYEQLSKKLSGEKDKIVVNNPMSSGSGMKTTITSKPEQSHKPVVMIDDDGEGGLEETYLQPEEKPKKELIGIITRERIIHPDGTSSHINRKSYDPFKYIIMAKEEWNQKNKEIERLKREIYVIEEARAFRVTIPDSWKIKDNKTVDDKD